jgi:hypothetical protein
MSSYSSTPPAGLGGRGAPPPRHQTPWEGE